MNKMKTYRDFLNEGVKDLMVPKSEEDIKNSIGEKKFNVYKSLINAKNSIKPPFETDNLSMLDMMEKRLTSFEVTIRFLKFTIVYDTNNIWTVHNNPVHSPDRVNYSKTWGEAWSKVMDITNYSFNKEISVIQNEINRHQENVDELKELLSQVSTVNESVRDMMTPMDTTEIDKKIVDFFEKARNDDDVEIDSTMYYDYWEELAEKYKLFDSYYAYKGRVYTINFDDNNDATLSCTYEDVTHFQQKLFDAIEKIDILKKGL